MPSPPHYSPVYWSKNEVNIYSFCPPGNDYVRIFDGFKFMFLYVVNHSFFEMHPRMKYNTILDDFFFKVECGKDVLANKD